ncbi:NCS2 family permease [Thermospira aquatica]|uniref:NCS2 family permease n=1 Tax=Thermospira aquatica TaxID=2828656 RepID=A0AAX3BF29_9SPIR|nr:NCS2 family permease [Thermospira aquatica]URA10942.1 NCS2 family permease [Thermospira aquatica]
MEKTLGKFFEFSERKTSLKVEVLAGISTFLTMAYIIVVNPGILSLTGMDFSGVLLATVLVASISSVLMGLYANLPYALAPGMGINAFFTFSLVMGMGLSWQTALGAVFLSGIIFIILSILPVRLWILHAVPKSIRYGVAAGIGVFLTLIGFKSVGFIVSNEATLVGFGGINAQTLLFIFGLILTSILVIRRVKGALILGIMVTSIATLIVSILGLKYGWLKAPLVELPKSIVALPKLDVFFKLDILGAFKLSMIGPVFSLLFTDMFDSISTFMGIAQVSGLVDKDGQPLKAKKALLVDAISTMMSGLFGTSSGTTYIESAAGIEEGGRTGLTAIVTGLLFLPFMFLSPLLSFIPAVATAPVLVIVGAFMMKPLLQINWNDFEETIPAFMALILIPLTYSITQGIVWGFLIYTLIKLFTGKIKDIHPMLYVIDVLAVLILLVK